MAIELTGARIACLLDIAKAHELWLDEETGVFVRWRTYDGLNRWEIEVPAPYTTPWADPFTLLQETLENHGHYLYFRRTVNTNQGPKHLYHSDAMAKWE